MKLSENWIREWVNPDLTTEALAEQLSMAGLEVDSVTPVATEFSGVVVGEVVACKQHPNADKLQVTKVNIGEAELLDIVCGAANCRTGLKVAVATVGAVLPGDFKIKKTKLRGEPSHGMLCSASELELNDAKDGIMELPEDAPIGQDFREWLGLNDWCLDIDLTPNRADCLGVRGVARELGVLNNLDVKEPQISQVESTFNESLAVKVSAPTACPRYLARVIHDINMNASTPLWMVERLRRSGIRSIDPVVDITNYVLLELGQPMHAFDKNKLVDSIEVRFAKKDEPLVLLDGNSVKLTEDVLVIADAEKAIAMAGVFGGQETGVTAETTDILLESAFFRPDAIAGIARRYGLHTDASHRYERGVDPELPRLAMERATALVLEICGGQAGPIVEQTAQEQLPKRSQVTLRTTRLEKVLGLKIPAVQVEEIFTRLGFTVETLDSGWQVQVPSYRFDIEIEEDLIEEVARVYGYNKIPEAAPKAALKMNRIEESEVPLSIFKQRLLSLGYQEIISYSFVDPKHQALLYPNQEPLNLPYPISVDMSSMRLGLLPGLLTTLAYNQKRQQSNLRLFEIGLRFVPNNQAENNIAQDEVIGGVLCGSELPSHWQKGNQAVDFYTLKGHVEALLSCAMQVKSLRFVPSDNPALHPGQGADIYQGDRYLGFCGALHPQFKKTFKIREVAYVFEFELAAISNRTIPSAKAVSKYPSIEMDMAFIVDKELTAEEFTRTIYEAEIPYLINLHLFDIYQGDNLPESKKSFALSFVFQSQDKTLGEQETQEIVAQIVTLLQTNFKAILRDS